MWSSIVLSFKSQVLQRPFHHWIPHGSQAAVCLKYSAQGIRSSQILTRSACGKRSAVTATSSSRITSTSEVIASRLIGRKSDGRLSEAAHSQDLVYNSHTGITSPSRSQNRRRSNPGLKTILPERLWYGQVRERLPLTAKWGEPAPKAGICGGR